MRLHFAALIFAVTLFPASSISADDYDGSSAAMATDLADVQACMAKADGAGDAARACLHRAADACVKRIAGNVSHAAKGACLQRETRIFQQLYRDRVMIGLDWAYRSDADEVDALRTISDRLPTFMATETTWQSYAEAECRMEMLQWSNGNADMVARPACQSRLYAERIALLDSLAKQQGWIRR
ncbi:hypothetical protein [Cypionkella sp. TWP1-2-1b2]|uniref:hypothetical protein n=1 Tax=Cypionkella sp. TWP1-2-1b2 TaxID=2804675 RepID=UPI003CE82447